ncbi:hypothetical protein, partial [Leclercia adecarboxylata]|uniref:hypothetical protein n=1 Tax=Leclercia adecarboxylata TaxID=83655 RepID=UPI003D989596
GSLQRAKREPSGAFIPCQSGQNITSVLRESILHELNNVRFWHRADPQEDPDMPLHLRVKTKGLPHKPSLFDRETWH